MGFPKILLAHDLLGKKVWHDKGILSALESGVVRIPEELADAQYQPNTLDVRIGGVSVWDSAKLKQRFNEQHLYNAHGNIKPTSTYPDEKDIEIVIPPKATVELTLHEHIFFDLRKLTIMGDFRSGKGRLGLRLNNHLITQPGEIKFSFFNRNPNPIILYGHDRIMQLLFYPEDSGDGKVVGDSQTLETIAAEIGSPDVLGPYLLFRADKEIYTFKKNIRPIDTRKKYSTKELFDVHELPYTVSLWEPYLIPLAPRLEVSKELGVQLLPDIPIAESELLIGPDPERLLLDTMMVGAGWIDSGYSGGVTAQAWFLKREITIEEGRLIAFGIAYQYGTPVLRPYGHVSNTPIEQLFGS